MSAPRAAVSGGPTRVLLEIESGLTKTHPHLVDAVRAQIYGSSKSLKDIADGLGCSPSDLSRKLRGNPADPRRFTVEDLERLPAATDSVLVIHWQIERLLESTTSRRDHAIAEIERLLPQFMALLKAATEAK